MDEVMCPADRYAVFGHPISHSLSPRIHTLFAEQTGQTLRYTALDVPAAQFRASLDHFIEGGGKGLNCTVPLKELAWRAADKTSTRAERAKAVNTLAVTENGGLCGDNTDGLGLVRDLVANLNIPLAGRSILLLGAGGASRGILQPLLAAEPSRLHIANRTAAKATALAAEFADLGAVEGGGFDTLPGESFDLILNATSASLHGALPPLPDGILKANAACYDLAYGQQPTAFVNWGISAGAGLCVDGIGMLVEQAAEAFNLWRGLRPQTRPVIDLLNAERGF
jgi:shikimate dehydrogenase